MPWCPVCKNEYREGYTRCKLCDVELLDSLENASSASAGDACCMNDRTEFQITNERMDASFTEQEDTYIDKSQKAEDYRSSAMALILVGGVGLISLILLLLDILPIHIYGVSKLTSGLVLGALYICFLIMGIHSWKLHKKFISIAGQEKEQMEQMLSFLQSSYTSEKLDAMLLGTGEQQLDEMSMYFSRIEMIKTLLHEKFPEQNRVMLEKIADDWYTSQFDREEAEEDQ